MHIWSRIRHKPPWNDILLDTSTTACRSTTPHVEQRQMIQRTVNQQRTITLIRWRRYHCQQYENNNIARAVLLLRTTAVVDYFLVRRGLLALIPAPQWSSLADSSKVHRANEDATDKKPSGIGNATSTGVTTFSTQQSHARVHAAYPNVNGNFVQRSTGFLVRYY